MGRDLAQKGQRADSGLELGFHCLSGKGPASRLVRLIRPRASCISAHRPLPYLSLWMHRLSSSLAQADNFVSGQASASFPGNINKHRPQPIGTRASQIPHHPKHFSDVQDTASGLPLSGCSLVPAHCSPQGGKGPFCPRGTAVLPVHCLTFKTHPDVWEIN